MAATKIPSDEIRGERVLIKKVLLLTSVFTGEA